MDSAEDSAVADFLQILEEHRRNCERQGKYVEAEIAKNRLEELKVKTKGFIHTGAFRPLLFCEVPTFFFYLFDNLMVIYMNLN